MRYNSQRQEFFADNGRVLVTKEMYESGYYEYVVRVPNGQVEIKTSKREAIDTAKAIAYRSEFAFNPIFDYEEKRVD